MAISISNAFVTLFDTEVKQAYQADAVLRNTVRLRTGVTASTHKFPKIGSGVAQVRVPQSKQAHASNGAELEVKA